MDKHNQSQHDLEIFKKTFSGLLKDTQAVTEAQQTPPHPDEPDERSEDYSGLEPINSEDEHAQELAMMDLIPFGDSREDYEEFAARPPLPPMNREAEAYAVSMGLQELRLMREYILYNSGHMSAEFSKAYTLYPLTLLQDLEETLTVANRKLLTMIQELEHLIAGDLYMMQEVQKDHKLMQAFESKRLSLLYSLLDLYGTPNNQQQRR